MNISYKLDIKQWIDFTVKKHSIKSVNRAPLLSHYKERSLSHGYNNFPSVELLFTDLKKREEISKIKQVGSSTIDTLLNFINDEIDQKEYLNLMAEDIDIDEWLGVALFDKNLNGTHYQTVINYYKKKYGVTKNKPIPNASVFIRDLKTGDILEAFGMGAKTREIFLNLINTNNSNSHNNIMNTQIIFINGTDQRRRIKNHHLNQWDEHIWHNVNFVPSVGSRVIINDLQYTITNTPEYSTEDDLLIISFVLYEVLDESDPLFSQNPQLKEFPPLNSIDHDAAEEPGFEGYRQSDPVLVYLKPEIYKSPCFGIFVHTNERKYWGVRCPYEGDIEIDSIHDVIAWMPIPQNSEEVYMNNNQKTK